MRVSKIERKTKETSIALSLNLDGSCQGEISTGVGFFDHMMELFLKHSNFDFSVKCVGDTQVDAHHSVEDIGICLGKCFLEALGDKKGITRYASILLPMDETLIMCACDISGRGYLNFDVKFADDYKVGDFDTELVEEFFMAFTREAGITLHIKKEYGTNVHHIIEGIFKAFARVLRMAVAIDEKNKDVIPSSKGSL